ncbi:unnamed protein product [Rhodiola kirilowii]
MGKQKGEAARSKARPSSSSLAASLLPSGGAAVGFGGYVGKSRLDSGEDAIANTDIDSEVTQHLKRLARKDPTTKLKALTSLSSLVSQKAGKDIISMIPQWAFEYKKLLLDYNREVRRATHDTMTSIVSTVGYGERFGTTPEDIDGTMVFSQFDSVSEVSQAAKRSLQVAFPSPEKRLDAIKLCATEIFMYLEENLKFTPQSMSDKELALDELQEMHQKVISSSLLALATLLDVLMDVQSEKPDSGKLASEPKHASKARVTATSYESVGRKEFIHLCKQRSPFIFPVFQRMFSLGIEYGLRFVKEDALDHFRAVLVDNILVKLLWNDYMTSGSAKVLDRFVSSEKGTSTGYNQYPENCLDIFQQKRDPEHVARQHAVQQGEIWPLVGLIGPTLGKFFSLLQSTESPDAISMLSVAVSVFGPRNIVKQLIDHNKDIFSTCNDGGNGSNEMNRHNFMHAFTDVFVPWCLHENKITVSSQLDLLLALLDDEYFHEQWSAVISYIIKKESSGPLPGSIESNKMVYQSSIENWHNEFLDSVALSIASSLPPYRDIDVQFVRDAFGVSAENKSSFLSRDVIARIFHEISQKLLSFVMQSSCSWIRDTTILFTARVNCHLNHAPCISLHEMAQFALCLLDGNLPMLILVEKSDLIVVILASLLICAWESDVLKASNEVANEVSENDYKARTHFGESVSGFIKKIDKQFLKDLTKDSRKILGSILMQFIRAAIVKEHKVNPDKIVSLCCQWTCYVLEHLPVDQYEEQSLLDQLLNKDDTWPMWSTLALSTGDGEELLIEQEREEHRLIAVVDKLISRIGVDKVLGGYSMLPESSQLANSRQWLAVEVLCTWKWQGGSVIEANMGCLRILPLLMCALIHPLHWNYAELDDLSGDTKLTCCENELFPETSGTGSNEL